AVTSPSESPRHGCAGLGEFFASAASRRWPLRETATSWQTPARRGGFARPKSSRYIRDPLNAPQGPAARGLTDVPLQLSRTMRGRVLGKNAPARGFADGDSVPLWPVQHGEHVLRFAHHAQLAAGA